VPTQLFDKFQVPRGDGDDWIDFSDFWEIILNEEFLDEIKVINVVIQSRFEID
jgi:hypothetical protein